MCDLYTFTVEAQDGFVSTLLYAARSKTPGESNKPSQSIVRVQHGNYQPYPPAVVHDTCQEADTGASSPGTCPRQTLLPQHIRGASTYHSSPLSQQDLSQLSPESAGELQDTKTNGPRISTKGKEECANTQCYTHTHTQAQDRNRQ